MLQGLLPRRHSIAGEPVVELAKGDMVGDGRLANGNLKDSGDPGLGLHQIHLPECLHGQRGGFEQRLRSDLDGVPDALAIDERDGAGTGARHDSRLTLSPFLRYNFR